MQRLLKLRLWVAVGFWSLSSYCPRLGGVFDKLGNMASPWLPEGTEWDAEILKRVRGRRRLL